MSTAPVTPSVSEISTSAELAEAAERWRGEPAIALDTEFVRERTFFPQLGLVQIADSTQSYLIDPLPISDLEPLHSILTNRDIVKVAHSVSEDLEVLYHRFGDFPDPLFDTQVAAALAGHDGSMGYRRLVAELFSVELAKGQTRTNWLRRPLTPEQKLYAARDVHYLLPAWEILSPALEETGRLAWVFEESWRRSDAARILPDPEQAYLRLNGTGRMNRRRLALARRLATWREQRARERDVPRNFILKESALLAIARNQPTSRTELEQIPDLGPRQRERLAERIFSMVREVQALPSSQLPDPIPTLPREERVKRSLNAMVEAVRRKAAELDVPPTSLASRRELKELLLAALDGELGSPPPPFDGWRWPLLGAELQQAIEP